jgi:hypothetical protein
MICNFESNQVAAPKADQSRDSPLVFYFGEITPF